MGAVVTYLMGLGLGLIIGFFCGVAVAAWVYGKSLKELKAWQDAAFDRMAISHPEQLRNTPWPRVSDKPLYVDRMRLS